MPTASRPTVRERLVEVLDEHVSGGALVGNNSAGNVPAAISRIYYADLLGVSSGSVERHRALLTSYELAYTGQYVRFEGPIRRYWSETSLDELRSILDRDAELGCLVGSRGQKLSRSYYGRKLGVFQCPELTEALREFDRLYQIKTGWERHLKDMRTWLDTKYRNGELMLKDGKVDRKGCLTHFGGVSSTPAAVPAVRDLFEEFDTRAALEGYLPQAWISEQHAVRSALVITPPDVREGLKVNITAVAAAANVDVQRFRLPHLVVLIANQQLIFEEQTAVSRSSIIVNDKYYSFDDLIEPWGDRFCSRVISTFKKIGARLTIVKGHYSILHQYLGWISGHDHQSISGLAVEARRHGRVLSAELWEDAAFAFRGHLIDTNLRSGKSEGSTKAGLNLLRSVLNELATNGASPVVEVIGIKNRRESRKKPSVIEPRLHAAKQDYIAFATSLLQHAGKRFAVEVDFEKIQGLSSYLEFADAAHNDPSISAAMLGMINLVLDEVTKRATRKIKNSMSTMQHARNLISISDIDADSFKIALQRGNLNRVESSVYMQRYFPAITGNAAASQPRLSPLGLANLLRLIIDLCDGVCPTTRAPSPYARFLSRRIQEAGGKKRIERLLGPDVGVVCAVLSLYLCETGANVSVGRTLSVDCVEPSELEGYTRVIGTKARAQGKPIVIDLQNSSFVITALNWLREYGGLYRSFAGKDKDRLFVTNKLHGLGLITDAAYTQAFKGMTGGIVEGATLVPDMLRPTVLLKIALEHDGRLKTGIALAQHGEGVSQGYQQKWPVKIIYDQNIRKFQEQLETVIYSGMEEVAMRFGTSHSELSARLNEVVPSGLGTLCNGVDHNRSGHSGTCSTLDCWNDCPSMILVAEKHSIASLQLWQSSLRHVQGDWERDHAERWEQVWLPWLCFADVVEEKMVRGPLLNVWEDARVIAAQKLAEPNFLPPWPF